MFGLKSLFARSKPIQYSSYVIVLALIVASKLYPDANTATGIKQSNDPSLAATVEPTRSIVTTIDRVVDGDTLIAGGISYRIASIDAPEKDQAFGEDATAFLRGLVSDTQVTIIDRGKDRYGRLIADASINGISLAELMIENGFAWSYMVPTVELENKLSQLQDKARAGGVGLWADPDPIRPSIYRELKHAANNQ